MWIMPLHLHVDQKCDYDMIGDKMVLYLIFNRINGFAWKRGTVSVNMDSQWSKQEACFACATLVWLAVNHNTSFTSGE